MIYLKGSRLEDRKKAFEWLYYSDFSSFLNELTDITPETIPTFSEFEEDYENFFFNDSNPEKGRAYLIILKENDVEEEIGFISYTAFGLVEGIAELDIWLKSLDYTGKGYGTSALNILSQKLLENGFHTLIIRPCAKNTRAVKSYKKIGFKESIFEPEKYYMTEHIEEYAPGDCKDRDDVFMVLRRNGIYKEK
jgi:RimJ/RimL family protein N-acetyltransferase